MIVMSQNISHICGSSSPNFSGQEFQSIMFSQMRTGAAGAASSPFRYMIWKANTRFELWKVEVIGTDWNRLEPPKYSSWMGDSYRDPERQYCFASKTAAQYVAPRTQKQRIRHQRKAQWWRVKLPAMESHLAQSIWNWSIVMMGFRSACWFVGGLEFSYIILKGIKINIPPPHWWLIVQLVNVVIL